METTQKIVHPDPVIRLAVGLAPRCSLSHMIHLREATLDDIPDAAETLSLAFSDYAWTNWTVAPDRHVDRIRDIQRLCLEHIALPHGLVYVEDTVVAVIALVGPEAHGRVSTDIWSRIQSAAGNAPAHGAEVSLPAPPIAGSWELATVGVNPRHRGNGLGTALIRHALDALDAVSGARTPVHLETSDARNVELYSRLGFATHAETHPFGGPVVWSMQRE